MTKKTLKFTATILVANFLIGTASAAAQNEEPHDSLEKVNRVTFAVNRGLDKVIIRPVAKTYDFIMPKFAKKGVTNFFSNLGDLPTAANDLLQGQGKQAGKDTSRFLLNSTVGVAGLFDVATSAGLEKNHQDFGLTMAKWGYKDSNYLVLPVLGPSSVRDTLGMPVNTAVDPVTYVEVKPDGYKYAAAGLNMVNSRANALPEDEKINAAKDPYAYVRDSYFKKRDCAIKKNQDPKAVC